MWIDLSRLGLAPWRKKFQGLLILRWVYDGCVKNLNGRCNWEIVMKSIISLSWLNHKRWQTSMIFCFTYAGNEAGAWSIQFILNWYIFTSQTTNILMGLTTHNWTTDDRALENQAHLFVSMILQRLWGSNLRLLVIVFWYFDLYILIRKWNNYTVTIILYPKTSK